MKAVALLAVLIALGVMASAANATTNSSVSLAVAESSPGAFAETTQTYTDSTGSYTVTSDAALESSTLVTGSDGYPCGDVAYNATYRWVTLGGLLTSWTYRSHFGVHVCHNKVTAKNSLYDEPVDSIPTWSWCGNIVRTWAMAPKNASAHSYTKGCFALYDKIVVDEYPWAHITIGGNGGLWVRNTGVN